MKRRRYLAGAMFAVGMALLLGWSTSLRAQRPASGEEGNLGRFDQRVILAQEQNDPGPVAALFSENAVLMAPQLREIQGKDAIERALGKLFQEYAIRLVSNDVGGAMRSPNTAAVWGTREVRLRPRDDRPAVAMSVRYLFVYRIDPDTGWRLLYAMAS